MKFTTKYICILLIILVFLGIFLFYLNQLTRTQAIEEENVVEGFDTNVSKNLPKNCPNLLINRGDAIVLYNTNAAESGEHGVKPGTHIVAVFKTLEEYAKYVQHQRSIGNYCPVLYLRQETSAQGKDVYKMYTPNSEIPDQGAGKPVFKPPFLESVPIWDLHHQPPFYVEGGLPAVPTEPVNNQVIQVMDASRENGQFNKDDYPGFDPYGLYVGKATNLDEIHVSTQNLDSNFHQTNKCSYNPADSNWCGVIATQQAVDSGMFANNEVNKAIYPHVAVV
uniref:Uncharacterized protein n=1 Tax=viral metagenome TaxID=1070528 RepID=A0A6C0IC02_9ZZZZ